MEEGIDTKRFEAVKKALYGDAVRRFDNTENIAMDMVECALSGEELFSASDSIKSITKEDVLNLIKGLNKDSMVLSVILPKEM